MSDQNDLIFTKINEKLLEHMEYLTSDDLKEYYETKWNQMFIYKQLTVLGISIETALLKAQLSSISQQSQSKPQYKYMVPQNLDDLQEELRMKALEIGITQDIRVDGGALFLYAIDKKFNSEVESQSNLYLQFLPYDADVEQTNTNAFGSKGRSGKETFQTFTIRMMKTLKDENLRNQQYRIRSSIHWIDNIQQLPEISNNEQMSRLIFDQYNDPGVMAVMNFLLYIDQDRINNKIQKDVQILNERAQNFGLPELYFQFYNRFFKILYTNSRQNLIRILNCLNVFRTIQKNLNIYFLDLNGLQHSLTEERIASKSSTPLQNQQEQYNAGFFDETVYLSNPNLAQHQKSTATSQKEIPQGYLVQYNIFLIETIQQLRTTGYWCEENIEYDAVSQLYCIIDCQGYKILNESSFQDFFAVQQYLSNIASYILLYSPKHGFEDETSLTNQSEAKQFLISLNREKVIQELLSFESQYVNGKCRILHVIFPYLNKCNASVLSGAIIALTQLMAQRPYFELKPTVFERFQDQCELIELTALICENIRLVYQEQSIQDDSSQVVKMFLQILDVAFRDENQFTHVMRRDALQNIYQNHIPKLQKQESYNQLIELPNEFSHLWMNPILDRQNNFNVLVNELITKAQKNGLNLSCNAFTILEFQRVRRKIFKTLLRMKGSFNIYIEQAQYIDAYKNIYENFILDRRNSNNKSSSNELNQLFVSFLEDHGMMIKSELIKIEDWQQYAGDQFKILDLSLPLTAVTSINSLLFNIVQLNNTLFKQIAQAIQTQGGVKSNQSLGQLININLGGQFIDVLKLRVGFCVQAQNKFRQKNQSKEIDTKECQNIQPQSQLQQQIQLLLSSSNQMKSIQTKSYLEQYSKKLNGTNPSIIYELCMIFQKQSLLINQTIIALNQREYLEQFNENLPFQISLLKVPEQIISNDIKKQDSIIRQFKEFFDQSQCEASDGMLDSQGNLANAFVVPKIIYILSLLKKAQQESINAPHKINNNTQIDEEQYLPGGVEWAKAQRLKLEKNVTLLSANKKLSKFRSSAQPFTGILNLDSSNILEIISSCMHAVIQLISLLSLLYAPQCNREDLIFWQAGFLGKKDNEITVIDEKDQRISFYKRNQLRLQRDLEPLRNDLEKYQKNILKFAQNDSSINPSATVLSYLCKITNRIYGTILIIQIASLNQFRNHDDNFHKTKYDESFHGTIRLIRRFLCKVKYGQVRNLVKHNQGTPQVLPKYKQKSINPTYESQSSMILLLQNIFLDEFNYIDQSQNSFRIFSGNIQYNSVNYFNEICLLLPRAIVSLIVQIPCQKLVYLSIIQETIITEQQQILRNRFIFEDQDVFNYERSSQKIIKHHLRILLLQEFWLIQKYKILPFEAINTLHLQDPISHVFQQIQGTKSIQLNLKIDKSKQTQDQQFKAQYELLDKLRIQSIESMIMKLCIIMTACHNLMLQEGIDYYERQSNHIAQFLNQQRGQIQINITDIQLSSQLQLFHNNFIRESVQIETLNKGLAFVIGKMDFNQIFQQLNENVLEILDKNYQNKINETQIHNEELHKMQYFQSHFIIYNNKTKKRYNQKSLENEFLNKKILFLKNNIEHIVESTVAQRTNDLIFENESLKLQIHKSQREGEIKIMKLKEEIIDQFKEGVSEQQQQYQQIQNRFKDYKTGINLELTTFINEFKKEGLQKIKENTSNKLNQNINLAELNLINTEIQQNSDKKNQIFQTQLPDGHLGEDAWENFLIKNNEINKLFNGLKKQRIVYKLRENKIIEKYEKQIKSILEANSSNGDLFKRIQELSDRVEQLKDEVTYNKRIMTVMDNQNQTLRRELQRQKMDRMKILKERGFLGASNYQQKFENKGSLSPTQNNQSRQVQKNYKFLHLFQDLASQNHTSNQKPNRGETLQNITSNERPLTAISIQRPLTALSQKREFGQNKKIKQKNELRTIEMQTQSKSQVIQFKYRIQK